MKRTAFEAIVIFSATFMIAIAWRMLLLRPAIKDVIERVALAVPSPSPAAVRFLEISCSNIDPCPSPLPATIGCHWTRCSDGNPFFHRGGDDVVLPIIAQ